VKIKSVETQLAKLPILKGVWGDAIYPTTHIEMMVLDLTTDTGLTGTGFTYTSGVGTTALKAIVDRVDPSRARGGGVAASTLASVQFAPLLDQPGRRIDHGTRSIGYRPLGPGG
jgi:L-alanine-DL-glutamate epimerase-like enolase superfamily enzyme